MFPQALFAQNAMDGIDAIVETALKKSKTPGAAVIIADGQNVEIRYYGYADKGIGIPVTPDTLFELGSVSKAYTGLGILYLEQMGALKLTDNVNIHLPWLTFQSDAPITIGNLLYHTSGIPFETLGGIPAGSTDDMLEKTVRNLIGCELAFYPGTKYSYATINYAVLGLIIEKVSGQGYEAFMRDVIFNPLGLDNTYANRLEAVGTGMLAEGYKTQFFRTDPYYAPEYRGNAPAGYIYSSAKDMARWMQMQMGINEAPPGYGELIRRSHIGDSSVPPINNYYYAAGWNVHLRGESMEHGGSNPNFSSMIIIDNEMNIGVCVLTNLNSSAAGYIADNIFNLLNNRKITDFKPGIYQAADTVFTIVFIGSVLFGLAFLVLSIKALVDIITKKRIREKLNKVKVAGTWLVVPVIVFYGFCLYYMPNILFGRLPWDAIRVWGSVSIVYGGIAAFAAGVAFFIYIVLTFSFPKDREKNYIALIPLSIINGLTSALIIFTINESFNRNLEYSKELLVYFIFSLVFFAYTMKLEQGRLISITNEITYEKRMSMIEKIINSTYYAIEKIGSSRIYSGLNNDTGEISRIPGIVVGFASNTLTLVFCFAYLFSTSRPAFIASISVLALNCVIGFITSRISTRYWEKNRDIQDIYFTQMYELIYGFKEIVLSRLRKADFWKDISKYSRLSANLSKEASIKFLNFSLYNNLMYNSIFGVVVFIFPLFIIGINVNDLRQTLFMVFYLIGPFGALMSLFPNLTQVRVNLKRINMLLAELDQESGGFIEYTQELYIPAEIKRLKFDGLVYSYKGKDNNTGEAQVEFTLGPINLEIKTSQITFITGGNGSGKSTLARLIAGLFPVHEGNVLLNGEKCGHTNLNDCFSAIFSDFHLFKKLYGIDAASKRGEIDGLFKRLQIDKIIDLNENGEFKSLNLSTGQKKRLAFVVCCLDDKPFMIFDEWAAEQDPEFRHFFYTELLPELKQKGKGVVVITHDDRYFHLADQMIKLEQGIIRR